MSPIPAGSRPATRKRPGAKGRLRQLLFRIRTTAPEIFLHHWNIQRRCTKSGRPWRRFAVRLRGRAPHGVYLMPGQTDHRSRSRPSSIRRARRAADHPPEQVEPHHRAPSPAGHQRFSELQRDIGAISQKALTASLRALERDGFVSRTSYATIPPRVDYALTALGIEALKAFEAFEAVRGEPLAERASRPVASSTPASPIRPIPRDRGGDRQ